MKTQNQNKNTAPAQTHDPASSPVATSTVPPCVRGVLLGGTKMLLPKLHAVISGEISRLEAIDPNDIKFDPNRATVNAGINEAIEALPNAEETPMEWALRCRVWFQSPPANVYSHDFAARVEAAGNADQQGRAG